MRVCSAYRSLPEGTELATVDKNFLIKFAVAGYTGYSKNKRRPFEGY